MTSNPSFPVQSSQSDTPNPGVSFTIQQKPTSISVNNSINSSQEAPNFKIVQSPQDAPYRRALQSTNPADICDTTSASTTITASTQSKIFVFNGGGEVYAPINPFITAPTACKVGYSVTSQPTPTSGTAPEVQASVLGDIVTMTQTVQQLTSGQVNMMTIQGCILSSNICTTTTVEVEFTYTNYCQGVTLNPPQLPPTLTWDISRLMNQPFLMLSNWQPTSPDCYKAAQINVIYDPSNILQVDTISVSFVSNIAVGTYSFEISASYVGSTNTNQGIIGTQLNVIDCSQSSMISNAQTIADMSYVIGDPPITIDVSTYFVATDTNCDPLDVGFFGPSWMVYDSSTKILTISTSDVNNVQTHGVELTAKTFRQNAQTTYQTFNVIVSAPSCTFTASQTPTYPSVTVDIAQQQQTVQIQQIQPPTGCGQITYEIMDATGAALSPNLFYLDTSNYVLNIFASDPTTVGSYNLVIKASFTQYPNEMVNSNLQVTITDECSMQGVIQSPTIPTINYSLGSTVNPTIPCFTISNNICASMQIQYSILDASGAPSSDISLIEAGGSCSLSIQNILTTGTLYFTVTAQFTNKPGTFVEQTFQLLTEAGCSTATITALQAPDETIQLNTGMKTIMVGDKFQISDSTCAPLTLTVSDATGAPLQGITVDSNSGTLNVDSSMQAVGQKYLIITAAISSAPSVTTQLSLLMIFSDVNICQTTGIQLGAINDITVSVGQPLLSVPVQNAIQIIDPSCAQITFTAMEQSSMQPPSWLTANPQMFSLDVQTIIDPTMVGTYTIMVTVSLMNDPSVQKTLTFNVIINPFDCSTATLTLTMQNPMNYIIMQDPTTYSIFLPLATSSDTQCTSITYSMVLQDGTALPAEFSFDTSKMKLNFLASAGSTASSSGIIVMKLIATLQLSPTSTGTPPTAQQFVEVQVVDCSVASVWTLPTAKSVTFTLGQADLTLTLDPFQLNQAQCGTVSYQITDQAGAQISQLGANSCFKPETSSALTQDELLRSFKVSCPATATSSTGYFQIIQMGILTFQGQIVKEQTVIHSVNIVEVCGSGTIQPGSFFQNVLEYTIGQPTQNYDFQLFTGDANCGNIEYVIQSVDGTAAPAFLSITPISTTFVLQAQQINDPAQVGILNLELVGRYTNYPNSFQTTPFQFSVLPNCYDPNLLIWNQPFISYNVFDTAAFFQLGFQSTLPACANAQLTLELIDVSGNQITTTSQNFIFMTNPGVPFGELQIATQDRTLVGNHDFYLIAKDSFGGFVKEVMVTVEIKDPCLNFKIVLTAAPIGSPNPYAYEIKTAMKSTALPQITSSHPQCGPINYVDIQSSEPNIFWLGTLDQIKAETLDTTKAGIYPITYSVKQDNLAQSLTILTLDYELFLGCNDATIIDPMLPTQFYFIGKPLMTFNIGTTINTSKFCGDLIYTAVVNGSTSINQFSPDITFGSTAGVITAQTAYDLAKLENYDITVTASMSGTTIPDLTYRFMLVFRMPECQTQYFRLNQNYYYKYVVGDSPKVVDLPVPAFEMVPDCLHTIQYSSTQQSNGQPLPHFLKFMPSISMYVIDGVLPSDVGQYYILLNGQISQNGQILADQLKWVLDIVNNFASVDIANTPPDFTESPKDIIVEADGIQRFFTLPKAIDMNNDAFRYEFTFNEAQGFTRIQNNVLLVEATPNNIGKFRIEITVNDGKTPKEQLIRLSFFIIVNQVESTSTSATLTDSTDATTTDGTKDTTNSDGTKDTTNADGTTTTTNVDGTVTQDPTKKEGSTTVQDNTNNDPNNQPDPTTYVPPDEKVLGTVVVEDDPVQKEKASNIFKDEREVQQKETVTKQTKANFGKRQKEKRKKLKPESSIAKSDPTVKECSMKGEMRISITSLDQAAKSYIQKDLMILTFLSSSSTSKLQSWTLVSVLSTEFVLMLTFTDSKSISQDSTDFLNIQFLEPAGTSGRRLADQEVAFALEYELPPQVGDDESTDDIDKVSKGLSIAMGVLFLPNLVLQIFLGVPMTMLWDLVTNLQIMVHMPVMSLNYPSNAKYFLSKLVNVANFEFLPSYKIIAKIFGVTESAEDGTTSALTDLGYKSTNILQNMGPYLVIFFFVAILMIMMLALRFISSKVQRVADLYQWMNQKIIFNLFLRILLIAYLNFSVSGILSLTNMTFSSAQYTIDAVLGILLTLVVVLYPIFSFTFMRRNLKRLMESSISTRFSTLYDNIDVDVMFATLTTTMFLVRRLVYAVTLNFLTEFVYFQILLSGLCSVAILTFYMRVQPMQSKLINILSIVNEGTIFILFCLNYLFTDYVTSLDQKYSIGYGFILIVILNVGMNCLTIFIHNIMSVVRLIKQKKREKDEVTKVFDLDAKMKNGGKFGKKKDLDQVEEEKVAYDKVEDQSPPKNFTTENFQTDHHMVRDELSRSSIMQSSFDNFDNHLHAYNQVNQMQRNQQMNVQLQAKKPQVQQMNKKGAPKYPQNQGMRITDLDNVYDDNLPYDFDRNQRIL